MPLLPPVTSTVLAIGLPPSTARATGHACYVWERELPGTPVSSIEIVTPIWRLAKLFADDRRRVLQTCGVDPATLDLLSVIRRSGPPYRLSTREITARALVTAGAISQRITRAEQAGLVARSPATDGSRSVLVTMTPAGHELIESTVDRVLSREAALVEGLDAGQRTALAAQLDQLLADIADRLAQAGPHLRQTGKIPK